MATFVMLTKLSPEAIKTPKSVEELGKAVTERLKDKVPQVKWVAATLC